MRDIVVLVKSAVDEVELKADASGRPALKGAANKLSNFDRIGVEEALRVRDAIGGTVTALSIGRADAKRALKEALAMGADKGAIVLAGPSDLDALGTAMALADALGRFQGLFLVLCSEGSSDTYQGQVGAMVAELMGLPFLAFARQVEVREGAVRCEQVFEAESLISEAELPAVVSVINGANKPRYPTLLQVMAAAKKPVEEMPLGSPKGGLPETGMEVAETLLLAGNRRRVMFDGSADEAARKLVQALREEGAI